MTDKPDPSEEAVHSEQSVSPGGSATVVVARFDSSRSGERLVASLGRSFRREARSGKAATFVVTRGPDGSFKLVQSRVVTASGVVSATISFTAAIMAGLIGAGSALRGAKAVGHGVRERQTGVGRDNEQLGAVFDQLDPHAAYVLFVCTKEATAEAVVARAAERGSHTSQHSRADVLALLDRLGSGYDWVRPAVTEPTTEAKRKHRRHHEPPASDDQDRT